MALIKTDELSAIVQAAAIGTENLIIDALAGTGKTSAMLECIKVLPQKSILMVAFNKRISDELKTRLPKMPRTHVVNVYTFHALGLSILRHHYPHLSVDKDATEELIQKVLGISRVGYDIRRAAMRLLRFAKESMEVRKPDAGDLIDVGFEHNLFGKLDSSKIPSAVAIALEAYDAGRDFKRRSTIDFCDMVWGPLIANLGPPARYQAIIVDELQDISYPQMGLVHKMCVPTTRIIAAGDRYQQIYGWRGSMGAAAWTHISRSGKTTSLPLTVTWRCPRAVVAKANGLVPSLKPRPGAADGVVGSIGLAALPDRLMRNDAVESTFVLSRNNANLLDCALFLWRHQVKFQLNAGQELLEPIFTLLDYTLNLSNVDTFKSSLEAWYSKEKLAAEAAGAVAWIERIDEQRAMLEMAVQYAKPTGIKGLLQSILLPNESRVLLSTVHKVKGLEADDVYMLKQTFARYQPRGDRDPNDEDMPPKQEELNIEYVAITRSKHRLTLVDLSKAGPSLDDVLSVQTDNFGQGL